VVEWTGERVVEALARAQHLLDRSERERSIENATAETLFASALSV
jgi:hypothetical protein